MKPALLIALSCASLAGGCATFGPEACAQTNWYRQGYTDGRVTWYSRIDEHVARCAASGVKPDAAQYQRGWEQGRFDFDHKSSGPN